MKFSMNIDFGPIKERAATLAQAGAAKTKKVAAIARLKSDNLAQKDAVRKAYMAIGQKYYAEHAGEPGEGFIELFAKADAALAAIAANNAALEELKATEEVTIDVDDIDLEMQAGEMPVDPEEPATEADFAEEVPAEAPAEEAPVEAAPAEAPAEEAPAEEPTEE